MKKLYCIIPMLAVLFTSCIQRDLEPCPEGAVTVRVYVESFADEAALTRAGIAATSESQFSRRVKTLDYYLYRDGQLIESGPVKDDLTRISGATYEFKREGLPNGEYKVAFMANCVEEIIDGDFNSLDGISINYPGIDDTDDYFIDVFPFTVSDDGTYIYDTQLKRLHGVVRYTFTDVDPDITAIEVTMDGLTSRGCFAGTYSEDFSYTKRIATDGRTRAQGDPEPSIVATFPTTADGNSTWSIRLYNDDSQTPFYERTISEDIRVLRNRLVDLTAVLKKDNYSFSITVNTDWNGGNDGGITIIN